jgi:hypothetical protein
MIVKWFKHGSGDGKAAFNYLLNHRIEVGTSRLLRGNANLTLSIIQSLKFKKKYKSGCLSFEELNVVENEKQEIMNLFEKAVFAGIPEENRNICWIEHTDKNRLELNFVITRVELETGKSYQPYFDRVDRKRFEAFRDYVNKKYGFSNPNDPQKSQSLRVGDLAKYSKIETLEYLNNYITNQVEDGQIINQDQVVAELKNIGYLINRVGANYITIQSGSSKPIRLKGKYYCKDWDSSKQVVNSSLNKIYKTLLEEIEKAKIYNQKVLYGIEKKVAPQNKSKLNSRKINDIKKPREID